MAIDVALKFSRIVVIKEAKKRKGIPQCDKKTNKKTTIRAFLTVASS